MYSLIEAGKVLSRVLIITDPTDIGLFGDQMRKSDPDVVGKDYASRACLPHETALALVLLNLFHGAADNLRTGWKQDVIEPP